jgi:hypothetical protein
MTEFEEINQKAWEIAAMSIMFKNRKFEAYSNGQIRNIFELAKSKNFENDIDTYVKKYSPQPAQGQRPQDIEQELKEMKGLNEIIANVIRENFKKWKLAEKMKFSQYLMWNIRIIEQRMSKIDNIRIDEIKLILDCENIKDQNKILDHLVTISKNNIREKRRR